MANETELDKHLAKMEADLKHDKCSTCGAQATSYGNGTPYCTQCFWKAFDEDDKRCPHCGSTLFNGDQCATLSCWMEAWEREYLDGQTRISRAEAIRRYNKEHGDHVDL